MSEISKKALNTYAAEGLLDKYFLEEWDIRDKSQRERLCDALGMRLALAGSLTWQLIYDKNAVKPLLRDMIEILLNPNKKNKTT